MTFLVPGASDPVWGWRRGVWGLYISYHHRNQCISPINQNKMHWLICQTSAPGSSLSPHYTMWRLYWKRLQSSPINYIYSWWSWFKEELHTNVKTNSLQVSSWLILWDFKMLYTDCSHMLKMVERFHPQNHILYYYIFDAQDKMLLGKCPRGPSSPSYKQAYFSL